MGEPLPSADQPANGTLGGPPPRRRAARLLTSPLFWKACSWMAIGLLLWLPAFYALTVPLVDRLSQQIGKDAARGQLETIHAFVAKSTADLAAWNEASMEARKRKLRSLIDLIDSYIAEEIARVERSEISQQAAQRAVLERLRHLRHGDGDYVWVANDDSVLISHPEPAYLGRDMSAVTDINGTGVVQHMVAAARAHGDGFHTYLWPRLNEESPGEKLSYYRYVPEWRWTLSTGIYLHEVRQEFGQRKAAIVEALRHHLHDTHIAGNGYVYVFDGEQYMMIHPDRELEGEDQSQRLDPATGKPLMAELMQAAQTPGRELSYVWDHPRDPGHFVHRKIAWVRYLPEQNWYVVAAAYVEDLAAPGRQVAQRTLLAFALGLLITAGIGFAFVRSLTAPILRLADSARRSARGELTEITGIERNDEIGQLAQAFNRMVAQVRDHIRGLEQRVRERTREIEQRVSELQERTRELETVDNAVQSFQACESPREVAQVLQAALAALDGQTASQLLLLQPPAGGAPAAATLADVGACWALRLGRAHRVEPGSATPRCAHVASDSTHGYICIPLSVRGAAFGVLHLTCAHTGEEGCDWNPATVERVGRTLADQAALTLTNLSLRERLQDQSIHDPLTGLYNRRYLDEWLQREARRARREGSPIGIVMLDLDHFKRVNDEHGHEAGDAVLKSTAGLIASMVRGSDIACRFGGEEFMLVLPGATLDACRERAEALRQRVEAGGTLHHGRDIRVTISAGVAVFPQHGEAADEVIAAADAALYRAKAAGRNRVEAATRTAGAPAEAAAD